MDGLTVPDDAHPVKATSFRVRRDRWIQKLLTDPRTRTPAAVRDVGVLLATMCRPDQPFAYPSGQRLAGWTGHGLRSVERAIAALRRLNYLSIQSGGINLGTGRTYTSRYFPNFDFSDSFNLGGDDFLTGAALPSGLADSTVSTGGVAVRVGGAAPSPLADESDRMSERSGCAPEGATPTRNGSTVLQRMGAKGDAPFDDLWALADEFGKRGDAGYVATRMAYETALSHDGVTHESLMAAYRAHLEQMKGHPRYTGHYLIKFLNDPKNYVGTGRLVDSSGTGLYRSERLDSGMVAQRPKVRRSEEETAKGRRRAIGANITSINAEIDELWTDSGLPTLAAVEAATGCKCVTHEELESAISPWWDGRCSVREKVRAYQQRVDEDDGDEL